MLTNFPNASELRVSNQSLFGASNRSAVQVLRRLGCFVLLVLWLSGGAFYSFGQEAPNVLLIIADDQGW
ncbi:MAG: hypothetical protein ACKO0N_05035, partial [Planctomycetota bacterium]